MNRADVAIVGDIHGNSDALANMLSQLESWEGELVFVGDYVNRGPDSNGVIEMLSKLANERPGTHFIAGNHDVALLRAVRQGDVTELLGMGGVDTIFSYLDAPRKDVSSEFVAAFPDSHIHFLEGLQECYAETAGLLVTHGPNYSRTTIRADLSGRYHVYGHRPTPMPFPWIGPDGAGIDTGCGTFREGRLTCLFWPRLSYIQT